MIQPHNTLNPDIKKEYIDFIVERQGYNKFVPYTFIKHLAYSFSYYLAGQSPENCIQETNSYTDSFREIVKIIKYPSVHTCNPIIFAIDILKIMNTKVSLRAVEIGSLTGVEFLIDVENTFDNNKFNLSSLSNKQLDALKISRDECDTVSLSEDIQKLLLFYDGIDILKQTVETEYNVVKQQIRSYSDFYKGRRYKLALPTFKVDLGMKKLQITKVDDVETKSSEVLLAIDYSLSMNNSNISRMFIRSILLYYIKQLELMPKLRVTVIEICGKIMAIKPLCDLEQLNEMFNNLPIFLLPVQNPDYVFNEFNHRYSGRSIIFLTDGDFELKKPVKLNCKLYSIVLKPNEKLKQMSLLSGGQFIILK